MISDLLVYPRIPTQLAVELLKEYDGKSFVELAEKSETDHLRAFFYPNYPHRVDAGRLITVRDGIVKIATRHGYPDAGSQRASAEFDREAAEFLLESMQILPSDAGVEEVWNFISLILLPHVAHWRYPNDKHNYHYERLIGKPRNVFRKLWWRAFVLGPSLSAKLGEDETVAIMERPSIGGNRDLARAIVLAHDRIKTLYPGKYPPSEFLRYVAVRIRSVNSVRGMTFLSERELQSEIDGLFEMTREAWDRGELMSRSAKAKSKHAG